MDTESAVMIALTSAHCHSLNPGINSLYFRGEQKQQPWGYSFFSKHSKTKDKNCVLDADRWIDRRGERIQVDKFCGATSAIEVVYDLYEIDKRENFDSAKAFQNRVKTPLKVIEKLGVVTSEATPSDLPEISALHNLWVEKKLADPRVHKITFSKTRYLNCVEIGLTREDATVLVMRDDAGLLLGCRVVVVTKDCCFDAANFVSFWERSQLSEACNMSSLLWLRDQGIVVFNTGIATGTLKKYKQHFPNQELKVWRAVSREESPELEF